MSLNFSSSLQKDRIREEFAFKLIFSFFFLITYAAYIIYINTYRGCARASDVIFKERERRNVP